MSTKRLITVAATATVCGCLAGIRIEKSRQESLILTAKAASPLSTIQTLDNTIMKPDQLDSSFFIQNKSRRVSEIMKFGYPSLDTIRTYDNFVLSYDRRNKTANWVLEHMSPSLLRPSGSLGSQNTSTSVDRSKSEFFEDTSVHPYFRSTNNDYRGSGFDRGHLAAAGNHKISQDCLNQTFVLSNISPQVGKGFNRDAWNNLEKYTRYRAIKSNNLWVCTGPLYLPKVESDGKSYVKYQVIGSNHVSVPTHFFKVLVVENTNGSIDLESYVLANQPTDPKIPLRAFQVPLDSIERAAGFLFFHQLPKNTFHTVNCNNEFLEKFTKRQMDELFLQKDQQRKSG